MAKAAEKRRATTNEAALRSLRVGMVFVNVLAMVLRYILSILVSRPFMASKKVIAVHLITFLATVFIWRWFTLIGSPKRDGANVKAGDDLNAPGVIELSWDLVYMTWICLIGSALVGDWFWWLYLLVPGFGVWKLFNLVKPLLGMFLPGLFGPRQPSAPGAEPVQEQTESKKQAKLRARAEKGDKRIQQVQRR